MAGPLHVVAAAILERGRVLAARRLPGGYHGGLWEFPGGKVEDGEEPSRALEREIEEELGILVKTGEKLMEVEWEYPHRSILLDVYFCEILKGEPKTIGCAEVRFVGLSELRGLQMPDADRPVVEALAPFMKESS